VHPFSRRLIERSPAVLRPPLALVVRTIDSSLNHRLPGLAAEIAFWVLLSLPALLLATIASAGVLGGQGTSWREQLVDRVTEVSQIALTPETIEGVVRPVLEGLFDEGGIGLVSFAFLATVWTASRAVRVVLTTIAVTAEAEDVRAGWQQRLLGFGLTLGTLLAGIVLAPLLLAGPGFGRQLAQMVGPEGAFVADLWRVAYWPTTVAIAMAGLALVYHVGVPGRTPWRLDLPGAVLATVLWLLGSGGLRLYGAWVLDDDSAYGSLAGPLVALIWLWLTGLAVLVGAEFNAQVARRRLPLDHPAHPGPTPDPG
jgi:membrane protein